MNNSVVLLSLISLSLLSSCSSPLNTKSSSPYRITRHTWWNYYQRGRQYLSDKKYPEAAADFETALGLRPGASYPYAEERWRARTYGMHMIEGYFPHRELGIALFKQNKPSEALSLLEISLKKEPSARAKFYINQIRHQMAMTSAPPPTIKIPTLGKYVNARSITVTGSALGTNEISTVAINGIPDFFELSSRKISFSKEIQLSEGENSIQISASDISGKTTATNLLLIADWTPPEIHLTKSRGHLQIIFRDAESLESVSLNGIKTEVKGKEYTLEYSIQTTNTNLQLAVSDRSGNKLEWSLNATELKHIAESKSGPPVLSLTNAGKVLVQHAPEYLLDIRAQDDTALKFLELNGEHLISQPTPLFRTARRMPLSPGTNRFEIVAVDIEGNTEIQRVSVVYRQPEYIDTIHRLATVQSPIEGELPDISFAHRTSRYIDHGLTRQPARFQLLSSAGEASAVKNEQQLSKSGLVDPRVMLKKGRKLNADLVFITRVLSDAPGQTVYTQVLNAENGKEMFIEDIYVEDPKNLAYELEGLIMKIEQYFPLIQARIAISPENQLSIDTGTSNGAQEGMRFLIIRSDGPFEEGKILSNNSKPLEAIISNTDNSSSRIQIKNASRKSVQAGDFVYAR